MHFFKGFSYQNSSEVTVFDVHVNQAFEVLLKFIGLGFWVRAMHTWAEATI